MTHIPAIGQLVCQRCGAITEVHAGRGESSVVPCSCGGLCQVMRIVHHPRRRPPASAEDIERSARERADEETLTP